MLPLPPVELRPRRKRFLAEHVFSLVEQGGVHECGTRFRPLVGFLLHVPQEQDDLLVGDEGDVEIGEGLGAAGEFGRPEIPVGLDLVAVDLEGLVAFLGPEVPWLEVDLARVDEVVVVDAVDGEAEGVVHEILAPQDGDVSPEAGDVGLVDAGDGGLRRLVGDGVVLGEGGRRRRRRLGGGERLGPSGKNIASH